MKNTPAWARAVPCILPALKRRTRDAATARLATRQGAFTVQKGSNSLLFATEDSIIYRKDGSPDRAVVIYSTRSGPITTQVQISYGNHAEIAGAVDAITFCAQAR